MTFSYIFGHFRGRRALDLVVALVAVLGPAGDLLAPMAFGRAAPNIALVAHVLEILVRAAFPLPQTPLPLLVRKGPGRLLHHIAPVLRERPGPREAEGFHCRDE